MKSNPFTVGAVLEHKNRGTLAQRIQRAKELMSGDLQHFLPFHQKLFVLDALRGEEAEFFADKMIEFASIIEKMPKSTKEVKEPIVYLHYFGGAANWWITNKDFPYKENPEGAQIQAFGKADLFGDGSCEEYGYIGIEEFLREPRIELDFHWTPKPAKECGHKN